MIRELTYNNRILSEQERAEFCKKSDEYIHEFSECIEGICQLAKEVPESENSDYNKIIKAEQNTTSTKHNIPRLEPENIRESILDFTAHFGKINPDIPYHLKGLICIFYHCWEKIKSYFCCPNFTYNELSTKVMVQLF